MIARLGNISLVLFSYPLEIVIARSAAEDIVNSFIGRTEPVSNWWRHFICVQDFTSIHSNSCEIVLVLTSYATALVVNSLGLVFAIIGATVVVFCSYIMPAVFFLKLTSGDESRRCKRVCAIVLLIGGCTVFIFCSGAILWTNIF